MRVVFDTNVLVAAARSQKGASFALVRMLPSDKFQICISNALYFEYLDVLLRPEIKPPNMTDAEMITAIDTITGSAFHQDIFFRWRPWLNDRGDDFVLELAIASQSNFIVAFNTKDFGKIGFSVSRRYHRLIFWSSSEGESNEHHHHRNTEFPSRTTRNYC